MGMIRRADIENYTRDALVMNLGDLEIQGRSVVQLAREQAEKIISDAKIERDRLLNDATQEGRDQGHAQGHAEGLKSGYEEGYAQALADHSQRIDALESNWAQTLQRFEHDRDTMYQQARKDVIELAVAIADRITKRVIESDPQIVESQMREVLDTLARPTGLVLRVHPDDLAYAEKVMPGLIADCTQCLHAEVTSDPALERGSCVAETEGRGVIDASITTQLERIVEALVPDERCSAPTQQSQGDAA